VHGLYDILVLKLDSNGDEVWHQALGRDQNEYSDMIHQVGNEYIVTGDTRSFGAGGYDVILYDLDSAGNEIWSQTYGDTLQNGCQGLLKVSDGNYLSYGETEIYPASPFDFYLEKIDSNGGSMWRYTYGGNGTDAIFSVKEDTDGGFICTGYSNSYNGSGPLDLVILKVDQNGIFQWKQTYGGPGIDIGYEIIRSVDNNGFIITGKTFSNGSEEYYLLKLNNTGSLNGIAEESNENYLSEAFPDPATDEVFISYQLPDAKDNRIILYNLIGEVLKEEKLNSNEGVLKLDIAGLPSGIYFCMLQTGGKSMISRKVVKR
jgi:hypothetical protein